jgi:tetratricopeptide (TPR) repeat protein
MNIGEKLQLAYEYYQAGNLDQAEFVCREILEEQPDNAEMYNNLGLLLGEKGNIDDSVACYRKALELDPNLADAHYNLGNVLKGQNQLLEAIKSYRRAIELDPVSLDALMNFGNALQGVEQYDEAEQCYQKALHISPHNADIYNNLGLTFHKKNMFDKAILFFEKAIRLRPDQSDIYNNLGFTHQEIGSLGEAIRCYRKAIQLDSNYANAHWNLSRALLLVGDYKEGWKEYEWRWKADTLILTSRHCSQSLFTLENIAHRIILLNSEQGFGDNIQCVRYVPLIAQRGAKVIVECYPELYSLFGNMDSIYQVIRFDEDPPPFDLNCPIFSLPLIFETTPETIPTNVPYLTADASRKEKWREKIMEHNFRVKIGLVWAGNPKIPFKHLSLDDFAPFGQLGDVGFYSLQKGRASEQSTKPPQGMRLFDYTAEINDFCDTAALIESLDLVIAIDTAVSHLAGAIGKPVWTLLPFVPDWRWMLDREDSPWYPTMRLFRQPALGDWRSVITKVVEELQKSFGICLHQ